MDDGLFTLLSHGSLVVLTGGLLATGLGLPVPEELLLLLAGALARASSLPLLLVIGVCACGVLGGDVILFSTARRLGPAALERPAFQRLLPHARRAKLEDAFRRRGGLVILAARHIAGLRAPVFALAGVHGMPLRTFLLWDLLGVTVSVPLVATLGYVSSDHLQRIWRGVAHVEHWLGAIAGVALAVYVVSVAVRRRWGSRRLG
jgi:membrane protein DedA with SNARE-associated domain